MTSASRRALALAGLLTVTGTTHLVRPRIFDPALPEWLPGPKRAWAIGSGVAELGCAALTAYRPTRRVGGWACAALFVAVFPGNLTMVATARSRRSRVLTLLRLPLQVPLVWWAWRVAVD